MQYELVILGSGESGTGAALLAKAKGISVFVSDKGNIPESFKAELAQAGIPFEEGMHSEDIVLSANEVVKSPGIPEKVEMVKQLREKQIPIISEIEFAYRYKGESKIVCITGSNGKTTTTSLVFDMFQHAAYDVSVVGNIGNSFARQIAQHPTHWYVMEISSFQLDDIHTFKPDIAVILNITPDHLDRYNYDFSQYTRAKFNIAKYQDEKDVLILCKDDKTIQEFIQSNPIHSKTLFFTMNEILPGDGAYINEDALMLHVNGEGLAISINDLALKGKHNQYNSMAAGISARVAELRTSIIKESLKTFASIEHRLEVVANIRGVEFINDSKATNLNSVWYALETMKKPTVLILGGVDKGNDYNEIKELVQDKVKAIVCLGIDNNAILNFFNGIVPLVETRSADEAVHAAYSFADKGDCVLLSPACASFDLFKNYEDRGDQFKSSVKAL